MGHHGTTVAEHVCAEERVPTGAPQQPALLTARPQDPALGSTGEGPGTGTPQPRDCSAHGTGAWGRPLSPRPRGTSSWSLTMPRLTDGQASGRGQQHSVDSPGAPPGAMSTDTGSLCTRCPLQLGPWSPEPPSTPQVDTWTSSVRALPDAHSWARGPLWAPTVPWASPQVSRDHTWGRAWLLTVGLNRRTPAAHAVCPALEW